MTVSVDTLLNRAQESTAEEAGELIIKAWRQAHAKKKEWELEERKAKIEADKFLNELGMDKYETNAGTIRYITPKPRISYNAGVLDAICEHHPEVKDRIWHVRKENLPVGYIKIG